MRILLSSLLGLSAFMCSSSIPAFDASIHPDRDLAEIQVAYRDASRRILDVSTRAYTFSLNLDAGTIENIRPRGSHGPGMKVGLQLRRETRVYVPAIGAGRINIDRFGPLMYDIHLRDLRFRPFPPTPADQDSNDQLEVWPDLAIRAFPDRIHLHFTATATAEAGTLVPAFAFGLLEGTAPAGAHGGDGFFAFDTARAHSEGAGVVVVPLGPDAASRKLSRDDALSWRRIQNSAGSELRNRGDRLSLSAMLVPAPTRRQAQAIADQVRNPLPAEAFALEGAAWEGADPAWGVYQVRTDNHGPRHFEVAHVNPNSHVRTDLRIQNDDRPRSAYLRLYNNYGCLEATVLTDKHGVPLPIQVQTGKNFGGEKEEGELEGDHAFGESILRFELDAGEVFEGRVLHLFGNWGNHPLKQISSIRFYRHYFHASIGPTETICYVPFPYPRGDGITYSLADVRGLSTPMWPGQPQHDHVSVIGYLRYQTTAGWVQPRLTHTSIYHTGPNFARMAMDYRTEDDRADARFEFFELPQTDETRCFSRIRYTFEKELPLAAPPSEAIRFVNAGAYIVGTVHDRVTWIAEDGKRKTETVPPDGSFALRGEPLGTESPFVTAYAHEHGNILFLVRSWKARLEGREAPPAVTVQGGERFTEVYLTAPETVERILPGDFVEAEIVVVPYGEAGATDDTPGYEHRHYGPQGPAIDVLRGTLVEPFPWRVRSNENGVAEVKVSGGLDSQVLIVEGLSERRCPMLWENAGGWMYVDSQVHGNDGTHLYRCKDGSVGAVFVVNTRPGQQHHYLVCEPPDHGPVRAVGTRNGRVTVEYDGAPPVLLTDPPA
jgi:hypothetical protein